MRRTSVALIVALVVSVGLVPGTAASAGQEARRVRYYEGTTSQGGRLSISVVMRGGVPYLNWVVIDGPYICEDGTPGEIADDGFGWVPSDLAGPVITDEPFDVRENAGSFAFMMSGHLGSLRGSGALTFLMPALTADERAAQVCTFGGTWSVERIDTFPSAKQTMMVEVPGRTLAMGLAVAGSRDPTTLGRRGTGPIRHYHGRTALDTAMALRTRRAEAGIDLLFMELGYSLACEDGDEIAGALYPLALSDSQVMPPGRLDLDITPTSVPSPWGAALHLQGVLDAHLGSGTVSMIWPWLTEGLGAQLCRSGEQTWRLWRTDAGF